MKINEFINKGKLYDPRSDDELMKGAMGDARRKYDNEHGYGSFLKLSAKEKNDLTHKEIVTRFRNTGRKVPKYASTFTSTIDGKVDKHTSTFGEGVGRITKQNQTADVGPNEIKKQAAKFGFKVDKDGRPDKHPKKVSGSKTNVLFNLGMAENRFTPTELAIMEGGHSIEDYHNSIQEVSAKDLSQESEVFVDMDGVLADFFGAWKKLIGKDWRNIDDIDDALQRIRDKDDFWLKIPKTANAMNLLGLIKQLKGKYNILSAPLANDPNSEPHKREWIAKNLKAFPPNKVYITADKAKFATQPDGTPNILIDDFGQNINKWTAAGGVGFKHKDHKFERTVKNLAQHMKGPAKETYARDELPQITKKELKDIWHTKESVAVKDIIPVQKERIQENYAKQLRKIASGNYAPIVVDCENKIINGHHRYDIIKKLAVENVTVVKLPLYLENLVEGNLLANPKNSILVRKDDNYDWYRIGTNMANIKSVPSASVPVKNKPDIYVQFYGGEKEKKYMMKQLSRLGYDVQDADGYVDPHFDEATENNYVLRIRENFADGKKKGKSRPGRVKRSGASCNGSVTSLRKRAKNASGEKAKMYHWCANMKSGRKKSESYTREQFYNILVESTPQQLEEGIKDQLAKLPKNMLAKVQPILKKIPKTGKSLVLIATLLGVMVNAVAAGDMAKADVQVDKLNNMATMSTTADAPTKADKGGFDLDDVNYDRNYKGDVNKVFKVQDTSVKDAKAMYDKLGGVSNANYEKMKEIVFKKIDDLRSDYKDATAKKGLSGKDALQSDEFKDFRKQSNDLKIMLSKAMEIMTKDAGATGSILKPTGKIIGK